MINKNISFIGIGHICKAIIKGLFREESVNKNKVVLSGPHLEKFKEFAKKYGVKTVTGNVAAAKQAEIIFISVRPKTVKEVIAEIRDSIKKDTLIISVAAGITFDLLKNYFARKDLKLVRIMPNIPVAYGLGVVGWVGENLTSQDKNLVKSLFRPLGLLIDYRDEESLDKLSMISGCGIGYVSYFINNLEKIAKSYGLEENQARQVVLNTFAGTLKHLVATSQSPDELTKAVATKGGITEEVINSMEERGFYKLFLQSVGKGYVKIKRL